MCAPVPPDITSRLPRALSRKPPCPMAQFKANASPQQLPSFLFSISLADRLSSIELPSSTVLYCSVSTVSRALMPLRRQCPPAIEECPHCCSRNTIAMQDRIRRSEARDHRHERRSRATRALNCGIAKECWTTTGAYFSDLTRHRRARSTFIPARPFPAALGSPMAYAHTTIHNAKNRAANDSQGNYSLYIAKSI